MIRIPTIDALREVMNRKGYKFFENGDYNLNLIGIRSATSISDHFDDLFLVAYKVDGKWELRAYKCTTDPGAYWLLNPMRKAGTIIMVPGQYRGAYKLGLHGRTSRFGPYKALEQVKPIRYVRDNTKDNILDFHLMEDEKNIFEDICKTNIHRASKWKTLFNIGKYSAGCQVIQSPAHFAELMQLCEHQISHGHGNGYTYTLLKEIDFYGKA